MPSGRCFHPGDYHRGVVFWGVCGFLCRCVVLCHLRYTDNPNPSVHRRKRVPTPSLSTCSTHHLPRGPAARPASPACFGAALSTTPGSGPSRAGIPSRRTGTRCRARSRRPRRARAQGTWRWRIRSRHLPGGCPVQKKTNKRCKRLFMLEQRAESREQRKKPSEKPWSRSAKPCA